MKTLLVLIAMAFAISASAQAPQKFNYQAVARDASGNPISDKNLAVRISIIDGSGAGAAVYSETFTATTGKQGLFSIQVGAGTVASGTFGSIVWGGSPKFLKVEIDPAGGSAFTLLGTSQLLSVPFAFTADKLSSPMAIADLSDVSDTAPSANQILKWNGTAWEPGTVSVTIPQQNATNGQVLQWNGTEWKPATITGGVGDNWGTQQAVTDATLVGNGTSGAQLGLAPQGATTGQVLKWNGTAWLPAADAGDNWGTAKVNASSQFDGDGTPVNPLKLAQQSASTGQFLKWSGTSWIPGDDGGSLTLPAALNVVEPGVALQISNTQGTGVTGINSHATNADVYGVSGRVLSSTGTGTAGVFGKNTATGSNGYGVFGLHTGSGAGVYGEVTGGGTGLSGKSSGANGSGVFGIALGANGNGVIGSGATGVNGTSSAASGIGIYGNATGGGFAGWFDEKVFMKSNGSLTNANLLVRETENADRARLRLDNNISGKFWDIDAQNTGTTQTDNFHITHYGAGSILTVTGAGFVGIGQVNPATHLDVNGSVKIAGTIMVGGSTGANGQVLQSTATGTSWISPTNALFNNTLLKDQDGTTLSNISTASNTLSGLDNMTFTTTANSRVIYTFSHGQLVSNGTGDVDLQVEIGFINTATGLVVNRAICSDVILNNKKASFSYTHHCFLGVGQFQPYVYIGTTNSGRFNAVGSSAASTGQVSIQIIQQ